MSLDPTLIISILVFLYLTYKYGKVLRIKDAPQSNKTLAVLMYVLSGLGLIAINLFW